MKQELAEESVRPGAADWYTGGAMKTIDVSHLPPDAVELIEKIVDRYRTGGTPLPRVPFPLGFLKDGPDAGDVLLQPMSDEELKLWEEGHEGDPLREL
jgi:hypothetical protein